ncbi:recombinase family protein [Streptomyces sp. NPDC002851]
MILAGESISAVARKWTEAGLLSPRSIAAGAKAWTLRGVKKVLTSPRYIGQRTYRGEVMGEAEWPATSTTTPTTRWWPSCRVPTGSAEDRELAGQRRRSSPASPSAACAARP